MKSLWSVMALAIALGLAWPSTADAQSKQTSARKATTTQQKATAKRRPKAVATPRAATQKPCVRHTWFGCVGWDPDPNVRDMLAREVGDDDG
jgi:hypothetical protein